MDWSKGYSSITYMTAIDPRTWRDMEMIRITSGQVKRSSSGLRESADVECINYSDTGERWVRIYMSVQQNDNSERVAIFTGLATSPDAEITGELFTQRLQCYSVLKPVDDVILPRGWYATAGQESSGIIRQLLSVTPAPVVIADNAPYLATTIIAEDGETNLTMLDRVLTAINWRLRIAGDGTINAVPQAYEESAVFDPNEYDVIEDQIKTTSDWYECPNALLAVEDDLTAVAIDDSTDSAVSTVNRGREVWAYESGCELADNESIAEYAQRRLRELQQYQQTASYDRRYIPDVLPGDLVRLRYQKQGLDDVYKIDSQSITLGYGARTAESIATNVTKRMRLEARMRIARVVTETGDRVATDSNENIIALDVKGE